MSRLNFKLEAVATNSHARAGRLQTLHGEVITPVFMPVGTQATVKGQTRETLKETGAQVLLANTYHLLLRPGAEVFKKFGGIHAFMQWDRPVLTDSGGFQIFSLPHSREMSDEGALFRSYVDGKLILLSPELSIAMQKAMGSDIMMVLDQCVPSTSDRGLVTEAMLRTHLWAKRSLNARAESLQAMFGIVQGACFPDLRRESASYLTQLEFDGFAIGGLAVGESKALREEFTEMTAELLPKNLPRYLMGVGTPIDILEAVHRGVDMFDCILPSSLAQRGVAYTSQGKVQLRRSVYKFTETTLDPACVCHTCTHFSRGYLHHLVKTEEILGWHLIGIHNLFFYQQLMKEIRTAILNDTFYSYYLAKREQLIQADSDFPAVSRQRVGGKKETKKILGDYEVVESPEGIAWIKQTSSGEVMHSVNSPEIEANHLYIEQSQLVKRLSVGATDSQNSQDSQNELVIWDVGLGAAANAMAVIRCIENFALNKNPNSIRPVHLVSFESDLNSLKLALKHSHAFTYLRHSAPAAILDTGFWQSKTLPLKWTLIPGNFYETLTSAKVPQLIFYDPFSFKTDSQLWSLECFQKLYEYCKTSPTELFTYSGSTAVRAGFLGAGFNVAKGVGTGPKAETTIAYTPLVLNSTYELLGTPWFERWTRSDSKYPHGSSLSEQESVSRKITTHFQFSDRP